MDVKRVPSDQVSPDPPNTPVIPGDGAVEPLEKLSDEELSRFFNNQGYRWLGAGTDIDYNIRNNVQPINELDRVAMEHDLAYKAALDDLEHGRITYDQAQRRIWEADGAFVHKLDNSWTLLSRAARIGMSAKRLYDWFFNTASYSYLHPPPEYDYNDEQGYEELPDDSEAYPVAKWNIDTDPYATWGDPGPGRDWVYTSYGWEKMDVDAPQQWRYFRRPQHPRPEIPISSYTDRNRNGIPDVLEKHKRRRKHYKFSRRK